MSRTLRLSNKYSAYISVTYILIFVTYIVLSTRWAASIAHSQIEQELIEQWKGIGFVVFSGIMIFALTRYFLRKQEHLHAQLLQKHEDLQIAERRFLAGSLANTLAHDANHILGSMGFRIESLKRQMNREPYLQDFSVIESSIQKMSSLFKKIQSNHRKFLDLEYITDCDLSLSLNKNLELVKSHPHFADIQFSVIEKQPHLKCHLNCDLFDHMTYNLILNAAQATLESGRPQKKVTLVLESSARGYTFEIHDSGPGIPESLRDKVTRPYFSTKPNGTGLGFQTVYSFLESQVGELIIADSDLLEGAMVRINFSSNQKERDMGNQILQ